MLSGEESVSLWIVSIVVIEAADLFRVRLVTQESLVPRTALSRRIQSHLLKICLDLNTDVDTFVADVPGIAFKQASNLAFTEITE
jgi:hypothetical protein